MQTRQIHDRHESRPDEPSNFPKIFSYHSEKPQLKIQACPAEWSGYVLQRSIVQQIVADGRKKRVRC